MTTHTRRAGVFAALAVLIMVGTMAALASAKERDKANRGGRGTPRPAAR